MIPSSFYFAFSSFSSSALSSFFSACKVTTEKERKEKERRNWKEKREIRAKKLFDDWLSFEFDVDGRPQEKRLSFQQNLHP